MVLTFFCKLLLLEGSTGNETSCMHSCDLWPIQGSGLMKAFNICENQLVTFLQRIEAGYPDNPYHNRQANTSFGRAACID